MGYAPPPNGTSSSPTSSREKWPSELVVATTEPLCQHENGCVRTHSFVDAVRAARTVNSHGLTPRDAREPVVADERADLALRDSY